MSTDRVDASLLANKICTNTMLNGSQQIIFTQHLFKTQSAVESHVLAIFMSDTVVVVATINQ